MKKHYTKPQFAAALIKLIQGNPSCVLDPTAGEGALLQAANNRWPDADLIGLDISRDAIQEAKRKVPKAKFLCVDALHKKWRQSHEQQSLLVVCNPPFHGESRIPLRERLDLRFFDWATNIAKNRGLVLFVLPQSIASNPSFAELRAIWLAENRLMTAIGLPQNAFKNTEANAVAIVLSPGQPTGNNSVNFVLLGRNGQMIQRTFRMIDPTFRFDPQYYVREVWIPRIRTDLVLFGNVVENVRRGIFAKMVTNYRVKTHPYIHSTDLRSGWISSDHKRFVGPEIHQNVDNGTVLLSRVGEGLWKKSALYFARNKGTASDCVYVANTRDIREAGYLAAMLTTNFMQWSIRRIARGITVPILNKQELLRLPVPWLSTRERYEIGLAWLNSEQIAFRAKLTRRLNNRISQKEF